MKRRDFGETVGETIGWIFFIGLIVFFIGFVAYYIAKPIAKTRNRQEMVITVQEKKVKDDRYLIFGKKEDGEVSVFEVTDSWLMMRFDSSDVYGALEDGHTYRIVTRGYRVKLLSWYPNIYEYEELEKASGD